MINHIEGFPQVKKHSKNYFLLVYLLCNVVYKSVVVELFLQNHIVIH